MREIDLYCQPERAGLTKVAEVDFEPDDCCQDVRLVAFTDDQPGLLVHDQPFTDVCLGGTKIAAPSLRRIHTVAEWETALTAVTTPQERTTFAQALTEEATNVGHHLS